MEIPVRSCSKVVVYSLFQNNLRKPIAIIGDFKPEATRTKIRRCFVSTCRKWVLQCKSIATWESHLKKQEYIVCGIIWPHFDLDFWFARKFAKIFQSKDTKACPKPFTWIFIRLSRPRCALLNHCKGSEHHIPTLTAYYLTVASSAIAFEFGPRSQKQVHAWHHHSTGSVWRQFVWGEDVSGRDIACLLLVAITTYMSEMPPLCMCMLAPNQTRVDGWVFYARSCLSSCRVILIHRCP